MKVPTVVSLRSASPRPTCPFASDSGSMKNCAERCCARAPIASAVTTSDSAARIPVTLLRFMCSYFAGEVIPTATPGVLPRLIRFASS